MSTISEASDVEPGLSAPPSDGEALAPEFDLLAHAEKAVETYRDHEGLYRDLGMDAKRILAQCLETGSVRVHSIEARPKSTESLRLKAAKPHPTEPNKPLYERPLEQITDLAAVRVITFFLADIIQVDEIISREFEIVERSDKSDLLVEKGQVGYQSIHYLAKLGSSRSLLAEYIRFSGKVLEIQVRTILQHTWAEIEHDIQYKSELSLTTGIRRRFTGPTR
jgi:putative GTP pyrophosphokinase